MDLCLVLGANYPFHLGGITPYLDRTGASLTFGNYTRMLSSSFYLGSLYNTLIVGVLAPAVAWIMRTALNAQLASVVLRTFGNADTLRLTDENLLPDLPVQGMKDSSGDPERLLLRGSPPVTSFCPSMAPP